MRHLIKATVATAVLAASFAAREATPDHKPLIYVLSAVVLFINTAWEVKPDRRVEKLLKLAMDERLKLLFAEILKALPPNQRLPFRVNLMVPRWGIFGLHLRIAYTYEYKRSDTDYGLRWPWPRGLCWSVLRSGRLTFADLSDGRGAKAKYNLSDRHAVATAHLSGVLGIPVRAPAGEGKLPSQKVVAVLNVDSLTPGAMQQLRVFYGQMQQARTHPLVEVADNAGLYF